MGLKSAGKFLSANWQPIALYGAFLVAAGWLLWWQLGTLTGGYSPQELQTLKDSTSLGHIFHNPLNAPFHLLTYALIRLGDENLFYVRLVAAGFGLTTLTIFYWLVRYWHGERSAVLGTFLFGTSAWFLHTSRLGGVDVMVFMLLALVACAVWISHSKGGLPLFIGFALATALLYVPGMIWFIGLGAVWQIRRIDRVFKRHLWIVSLGALLVLAALAPLGLAMYHNLNLAKELAGLPTTGWPQPLHSLRLLADVPLNLFIRGPLDPEHWLGRLAVLDAFSLAMFGLGVYLYGRHIKLSRVRLMLVVFVLGPILIALGSDVSLSLLVPFVYILVAAGAGFMIDYWYMVFPRNIIAQGVGVVLVCLAVFTASWYNLRHYFVAWPGAPVTTTVFTVPKTNSSVKLHMLHM